MKKYLYLLLLSILLSGAKKAPEVNYKAVNAEKIRQELGAAEELGKEGFQIRDANFLDLEGFYRMLKERGSPIFVSADAMLHIYHVLFDDALARKELQEIIPALEELLKKTIQKIEQKKFSGISTAASGELISYLKVSYAALKGVESIKLSDSEKKEIEYINNAGGIFKSALFGYEEDFSQYKPRGHYTKNEDLARYFRSMMYMGRLTFLAESKIVSEEICRKQTACALILSGTVKSDPELYERWKGIFEPISFLVGRSDDLTINDYAEVFAKLGLNFLALDKEGIDRAIAAIRLLPGPGIYSGLGAVFADTGKEADDKLGQTKGLRFFGQRFIIDSFLFTNLVYPRVGKFLGTGRPFTMYSDMRVFPMGLDLANAMSIGIAQDILEASGNSAYEDYEKNMDAMRKVFSKMGSEEWSSTVYNKWLDVLNSLFYKSEKKGRSWLKRLLYTFLGGWAEIRHDTILYAKQSYDMKCTAIDPRYQKEEKAHYLRGMPEQNIEFFRKYRELVEMTGQFYKEDYSIQRRFLELGSIARRMTDILENDTVTSEDKEFFYEFPDKIKNILKDLDEKTTRAALVADVHTSLNANQVLEEGIYGFSYLLVWGKYDGGYIYTGPVFNYYEFKVPLAKRMTDDEFIKEAEKGTLMKTVFE